MVRLGRRFAARRAFAERITGQRVLGKRLCAFCQAACGPAASLPSTQAPSTCAASFSPLSSTSYTSLPSGSFNLRGELIRFVVAEDLFGTCAVEYQPAGLAIKRAILKWAGAEQAGAVQLCK